MFIFSKFFKISFLALSLFSTQISFSLSDADYLKQLEMESGEDSALIDTSQAEHSTDSEALDAPSSGMELILDKKELISNEQGFEQAMKGSYPETYALYLQLTNEQKKQIYKNFTQSKRLYNSSLKIISTYLASH